MSCGDITTFNIQHGFVEGLVRGYRSGFLADADYHHLTQCETLEDVKLNLQETDYDQFLADESSAITPSILQKGMLDKLVKEFQYLRVQASYPLDQFLEYITYEYMIDNIVLLLKGTLNGREINELIDSLHPLGLFDESIMRSICTFEPSNKGYRELYECVLVDTPIGKYFSQFIEESTGHRHLEEISEVRNMLEDIQMEVIKSSLLKLWLEDFYSFCCNEIGGLTGEIMKNLLEVRADRMAVNITLNSFGTPLNDINMRNTERKSLYPSVGTLYPQGTANLSIAGDPNELGAVLDKYPHLKKIWEVHVNEEINHKSIDDAFYEMEVQNLELAFDGQMHLGCFYAYVKLKEQEIRNLVWIAECIIQRQRENVNRFIPIFSRNAPWRQKGKK